MSKTTKLIKNGNIRLFDLIISRENGLLLTSTGIIQLFNNSGMGQTRACADTVKWWNLACKSGPQLQNRLY